MFARGCERTTREIVNESEAEGRRGRTYIIPSNNTIQKLYRPQHNQEPHKGIHNLDPLRRLLYISLPDAINHLLRIT